ncbi:MAG: hypothetical protein SNF33_07000 [Candidatus Algichlamydia australiensis]|nr:hypothetical protein [Chlamydiales bacterium]
MASSVHSISNLTSSFRGSQGLLPLSTLQKAVQVAPVGINAGLTVYNQHKSTRFFVFSLLTTVVSSLTVSSNNTYAIGAKFTLTAANIALTVLTKSSPVRNKNLISQQLPPRIANTAEIPNTASGSTQSTEVLARKLEEFYSFEYGDSGFEFDRCKAELQTFIEGLSPRMKLEYFAAALYAPNTPMIKTAIAIIGYENKDTIEVDTYGTDILAPIPNNRRNTLFTLLDSIARGNRFNGQGEQVDFALVGEQVDFALVEDILKSLFELEKQSGQRYFNRSYCSVSLLEKLNGLPPQLILSCLENEDLDLCNPQDLFPQSVAKLLAYLLSQTRGNVAEEVTNLYSCIEKFIQLGLVEFLSKQQHDSRAVMEGLDSVFYATNASLTALDTQSFEKIILELLDLAKFNKDYCHNFMLNSLRYKKENIIKEIFNQEPDSVFGLDIKYYIEQLEDTPLKATMLEHWEKGTDDQKKLEKGFLGGWADDSDGDSDM